MEKQMDEIAIVYTRYSIRLLHLKNDSHDTALNIEPWMLTALSALALWGSGSCIVCLPSFRLNTIKFNLSNTAQATYEASRRGILCIHSGVIDLLCRSATVQPHHTS